ncbi:MAG: helix-hairpin-helix domain-containing protein [Spirosomataceae bacterium]
MLQRLLLLIRDEFGLSRSQARGFLVLAVFIALSWFGPLIYQRFLQYNPPVISKEDSQTADSLLAVLERMQPAQPTYGNRSNFIEKPFENPECPLSLFYFDPNLASVSQLQELGIPRFIAERIEKYRNKGGQFRQKEDL